jgi:hypothetical protein
LTLKKQDNCLLTTELFGCQQAQEDQLEKQDRPVQPVLQVLLDIKVQQGLQDLLAGRVQLV